MRQATKRGKFWFGLLAAALLLMGAAAALAAGGKTVAERRAEAEELLIQQNEMLWQTYVFGKPSEQAGLYRAHRELFGRDTIAQVKAAMAAATVPEEKRALGYFLRYLEIEYINNETAVLWDIESDLEANEMVLVDGKLVPYFNLRGIIANQADPAKRAELSKEEYRIYGLLNQVILQRIFDAGHRLAVDLGYRDYLDLSVAYRMFDLEELLGRGREFIDQSETAYLKLFDEVSPIPRRDFRRSDIGRLLGNKEFDAYFPADKLMAAAFATFDKLGVGDVARHKILVQDEPLPKKNPRAACFSVKVPADVRLTIKPIGGYDDYSALFHEFGHALHFAHGKNPVWEFQQLGSNAVTEGYAYLMQSLPDRDAWLKKYTTMPPAERQKIHQRVKFGRFYMARRYMAKLLYETEFHRGAENPRQRYQYWLSKAYGFQLNDEEATRYLTDLDPFLYAADYVQAFYLEAMLDHHLRKNFGKLWWENPKAGAFLTGLWAEANRLTGAELAAKLGYPHYDNRILLEYLEADD